MSDNVDVFEKIIFSIPSLKSLIAAYIPLSLVYTSLFILSASYFTEITVKFDWIIYLTFLGFLLPSIMVSELYSRFLPDYPREWSYFVGITNMTILFLYSLIMSGTNNFVNAWRILWLGLTTVYISNILILLLTIGYEKLWRTMTLSITQPLTILIMFHLFLGRSLSISTVNYLSGFLIIGVAALLLLFLIAVAEYLMKSNLENVSILQLTAGLLQKKQEELELGYPSKVDVQNYAITNEDVVLNVAVPWIHPGPLEGFGGGKITSDIIRELNKEENKQGFFFHVPSTHRSDPSNPQDYKEIVKSVQEPKKTGKASHLIEKSYENVKFYGRRFEGGQIVFMDAEMDDYEVAVFKETIDLDRTILVDLHCHDRDEEVREEVMYGTVKAERLKNALKDFLEFLKAQEMKQYEAGFATDLNPKPVFALTEKTGSQKTLVYGLEGNGTSEKVRELKEKYSEDYDKIIFFSTDTHRSIHDLSSEKQVETSRIEKIIEESQENLSKASIGLKNTKTDEINLLKEDYSGLVFSINMLIRLIGLSLAVMYVWLIIWVFF